MKGWALSLLLALLLAGCGGGSASPPNCAALNTCPPEVPVGIFDNPTTPFDNSVFAP